MAFYEKSTNMLDTSIKLYLTLHLNNRCIITHKVSDINVSLK